jgi:hypothetical protein
VPNIEYLLACECEECVSVASCDCQLLSERDDPEEAFAYEDVREHRIPPR